MYKNYLFVFDSQLKHGTYQLYLNQPPDKECANTPIVLSFKWQSSNVKCTKGRSK